MAVELSVMPDNGIDATTLEAVVAQGDLSKLSAAQKVMVYKARCDAAGLDYRTQPFQYITLSGKLTLYATKTATDQLIAVHGLKVDILDRKHYADLGVYEVQVRVTRRDGSTVDDLAAVAVAGLRGEALCNAMMKAVTKAKRRTVLSACGLGMLDETETETIPGARAFSAEQLHRPANVTEDGEVLDPDFGSEPPAWLASPNQIKRLYAIAKSAGIKTKEDLVAWLDARFKVEGIRVSQLTRERYDDACAALDEIAQAKKDAALEREAIEAEAEAVA